MASLGSLIVDLQVQNAQLKKGLDEATAKLDSFAKKTEGVGKLLGQAFNLDILKQAGAALAGFVARGAELADKMGKLAQSAGAPVEQFSAIAYGADLAGVSAEQLSKALGQLGQNMAGALAGTDKQAGATFKALGISITDATGRLRGAQDVMGDVADKFAGLEDGAAKTTLAQQLFGKSGADLIPMLNAGRAGLSDMADEAGRFGLVVSAEGARAAEEMNDAIARLTKVGEGLALRVAQAVAPAITGLADEVREAAGQFGVLDGAVMVLTATLKGLMSVGAVVAGIFEAVGKTLGAVAASVVQIGNRDFAGAWETMKLLGEDLADTAKGTAGRLTAIWVQADEGPKKHQAAVKQAADVYVREAKRLQDADEERARAAKKAAADREAAAKREAEFLKKLGEEQEKSKTAIQRASEGADANIAARRSAMAGGGGEGDTRGFSSFDAALKQLADSTKEAAVLTEHARLAELEGSLEQQRDLLKLADQQRRAAEEAGKAADAFVAIRQAAEQAQQAMLAKAIGPVQGLVEAGKQGATAGAMFGPEGAAVGAVAGVGLELLTQSEQFGQLMDSVGQVLQTVSDALGAMLEPLIPFANLVGMFAEALSTVLVPIFKALEPVFRFLYDVVKGFMGAVLTVVDFIVGVINAITGLFGFKAIDDSGIKAGLDKLNRSTFDTAKSTEKLGKAAKEATQEILNAPQGFKGLALARWRAADMDVGPPGSSGGGGGGVLGSGGGGGGGGGGGISRGGGGSGGGPRVNNLQGATIEVHVNADLHRYVKVEGRETNYANAGSTRPLTVAFDY